MLSLDLPPVSIRGPRPLPLAGPTGNLLRFFADPVNWLFRMHRTHGALAALSDRNAAMVFAFGAQHNRQILLNPGLFHNLDRTVAPAPEGSALRRLMRLLIMMNGEDHRRTRRLLMPAFQKGTIDGYRDSIVELTEKQLHRIPKGDTVDMSDAMLELTSSIVIRCMFGLDDRDAARLGRLGAELLGRATAVSTLALPFDLPGLPYRRLLSLGEHMEQTFRGVIDRKRAQASGASDALSILIRTHDEDGSTLSDRDLIGQCFLLYMAGYETTSHSLSWTLFLLSQHPEVFDALRGELQAKLDGKAPTVADLAELPLLDAVIKESMRILPATPMLFIRVTADRAALGEHELPRGTSIVLSPLVSHHMADVFPEPRRFRPDRWSAAQPSPHEYLPFGVGPRMCIGASFAALVLRIVVGTLVQRRRFSLAPTARVSTRLSGITLAPKHGLSMRVLRDGEAPPRPGVVKGTIHDIVDLPLH